MSNAVQNNVEVEESYIDSPFRIALADKTNSNKGDVEPKGYVNIVSS
jgi:hypothetical protein